MRQQVVLARELQKEPQSCPSALKCSHRLACPGHSNTVSCEALDGVHPVSSLYCVTDPESPGNDRSKDTSPSSPAGQATVCWV